MMLKSFLASSRDAVPCVMKNEGQKLYQMFQALFTMTNLHQASLPTVRAEFYAIVQKEHECHECMYRTNIADDTRNGGRIENPRQEQISKKGVVENTTSKT